MRIKHTLRQMECFVALAEQLHFGRAAAKVNMTQPAFSRQIMAIEEALDVKLVERNSHMVLLTSAGEAFLDGCRDTFAALENADRRTRLVESGYEGIVRIGYTDFAISADLPSLLHNFRRRFPRIVLEPFQGSTQELLGALEQQRLDVCFVTGPVRRQGLSSQLFTENSLLAVLWEGHAVAGRPEITMNDIADQDFIFGVPRLWRHYMRHIERVFDDALIQPNIVERAFNSEGLFGLVAGQMGITIYPDCVRNYYRRGLVLKEIKGLDAKIPTLATWRDEEGSPALANFQTFLCEHLSIGNERVTLSA